MTEIVISGAFNEFSLEWPVIKMTKQEILAMIVKASELMDQQNVWKECRFIEVPYSWKRRRPKSKAKRIQKKWRKDPWRRFA